MADEESNKQREKLFKRFIKMTPEELNAYSAKLNAVSEETYDESEGYRQCALELESYEDIVKLAKQVADTLLNKWIVDAHGVGNHPDIMHITGLSAGDSKTKVKYDVLDKDGKVILTPEQWFECSEIYVSMFRYVMDFDWEPDTFMTATFDVSTSVSNFERFIREISRHMDDDFHHMDIEDFRNKMKENRQHYIEQVNEAILNPSVKGIEELYNKLGIV